MTQDKALKVEGPLHVVCQCNWCKAHPEQNLSCMSVQARLAAAWGFVKAQPEPWEKFCDSNCVWTDHHPDCKLAEQEPVAWRIRCTDPMRDWVLMYRYPKTEEQFSNMEIQPLYATPPQRTWVGLTDNEIEKMGLSNYIKVVRETEAKLKEKNT